MQRERTPQKANNLARMFNSCPADLKISYKGHRKGRSRNLCKQKGKRLGGRSIEKTTASENNF